MGGERCSKLGHDAHVNEEGISTDQSIGSQKYATLLSYPHLKTKKRPLWSDRSSEVEHVD